MRAAEVKEDMAQESVTAQENKYRTLIETTGTGYVILDIKGCVVDANKEYVRFTGRKALKDILDRSVLEWTAPYDKKRNCSEVRKCLKQGFVRNMRVDYVSRHGKTIPIEVNASVLSIDGKMQIMTICRDISERKDAAEESRRTTDLLLNIINSSTDFIFVKDTKLRTILCNKAFASALGKQPDELYGKTDIENGWNPELIKGNPKKGIRGFESDDVDALHGKAIHNPNDPANVGGEVHNFDTVKLPVRDSSGRIFGMLGLSRDVTERTKSEEALRSNEEKFRTIFNNAGDGILLADLEKRKFFMGNEAICHMLGYSLKEINKLGVMDIHPKKDLPYVIDQFKKQSRGEIMVSKDMPVERKDGSVFYADINSVKITIAGKTYLMGFFHDITARKKIEDELKNKNEKLEKFNEFAVDRELRMVELKKEINALHKKLGIGSRYAVEE